MKYIGFTNIFKEEIPDLVTGWVKKEGSIESIIINGYDCVKENTKIKYDAEITIKYHTFPGKNT